MLMIIILMRGSLNIKFSRCRLSLNVMLSRYVDSEVGYFAYGSFCIAVLLPLVGLVLLTLFVNDTADFGLGCSPVLLFFMWDSLGDTT